MHNLSDSELALLCNEKATYLGFDYGERRTGVAIGQRVTGTASALETIRSDTHQALWSAIARLVRTWEPTAFVVGVPYPLEEGAENPLIPIICHFCAELKQRYQRPVFTFDEALSTKESQEIFYRERSKRSVQFQDIKDELAAQLILQTWLRHTASNTF